MKVKKIRTVEVFECGNCGRKYATENSRLDAEKCCICPDCGKEKGHNRGLTSRCEDCQQKIWKKRNRERINKTELVKYDGNKVYHDDNDHYFFDDDSLYCHLEQCHCDVDGEIDDMPEFIFEAPLLNFTMDADGLVEQALEEHHEDAWDSISNSEVKSLQEYLNTWCKEQDIKSYSPDLEKRVSVRDIIKEQGWEFKKEDEK